MWLGVGLRKNTFYREDWFELKWPQMVLLVWLGFNIEAHEQMKQDKNLSTSNWTKLYAKTPYGNENPPLPISSMNMILHGIESSDLYHRNTLTADVRQFQEKNRYDVILANPLFGGKEKIQIQLNFPAFFPQRA